MNTNELNMQLDLLEIDVRTLWKMYDDMENIDIMEIAWQQKMVENNEKPIIDNLGWEGILIIRKMYKDRLGRETYK